MKRDTRTAYRARAAATERSVDQALYEVQAAESIARLRAREAYEALTAPVPFTPEELAAALVVRTSTGWHKVVRVNAKSVTVESGYSWTDRYTIAQVLEVKP
jgi:hypothetical protein